jgi:hypothetical protein
MVSGFSLIGLVWYLSDGMEDFQHVKGLLGELPLSWLHDKNGQFDTMAVLWLHDVMAE